MSTVMTSPEIYRRLAAYGRARKWSPAARARWYAFIHELQLKLCMGDYNHGDSRINERIFHLEPRRGVTYLLPKEPHAEAFPVAFTEPAALRVRVLLTLQWRKQTAWRKKTQQLRRETKYWTRKKARLAGVHTPSDMTRHSDVTLPSNVVERIFSFLTTHTFTL